MCCNVWRGGERVLTRVEGRGTCVVTCGGRGRVLSHVEGNMCCHVWRGGEHVLSRVEGRGMCVGRGESGHPQLLGYCQILEIGDCVHCCIHLIESWLVVHYALHIVYTGVAMCCIMVHYM